MKSLRLLESKEKSARTDKRRSEVLRRLKLDLEKRRYKHIDPLCLILCFLVNYVQDLQILRTFYFMYLKFL